MNILGISAFYHDSAAALVSDGLILAGAQEERFTRKKHDERFPIEAVRYCLETANTDLSGLDSANTPPRTGALRLRRSPVRLPHRLRPTRLDEHHRPGRGDADRRVGDRGAGRNQSLEHRRHR